LEPAYYTQFASNNQLLASHQASLLQARYSLPLWDAAPSSTDAPSLTSQVSRMASQTGVSQKHTLQSPSLFLHRVAQGVVRERAMNWRRQHALNGASLSYWRIRRVLEAKERNTALARLNALAPTDQIAVRLVQDGKRSLFSSALQVISLLVCR
jgi:hypothetical protein